MEDTARHRHSLIFGVTVAALGYFVDVFDLILFSVVRVASLQSLGLEGDELLSTGLFLLNMQMAGMLAGGILWGIWGDRRGRVSVLFASILLYSLANIANGFVYSVEAYAMLRLLAGIGLAGELGAGITLVSEIMPKHARGYGTALVATVGVTGAIAAALISEYWDWRTAYFIGGALGMMLLVARIVVHESGMYERLKRSDVLRGDFLMLFRSRERLVRYLSCIFVGLPIWFVVGVLVTLSPEFGEALHMPERPVAGTAVLYCYTGLIFGDLGSGVLSQVLRSRKRAIGIFLGLTAVSCGAYLTAHGISLQAFYLLCGLLGVAVGYWAVFVTTAAEQFGTNIRATVATTVPNFVRGAVVPVTWCFQSLRHELGILGSGMVVGGVCICIAFLSLLSLGESFSADLEFVE